MWLKCHIRRPSEDMMLKLEDYDQAEDLFIIRRSISHNIEVEHTKTKKIHYIPCAAEFKPYLTG